MHTESHLTQPVLLQGKLNSLVRLTTAKAQSPPRLRFYWYRCWPLPSIGAVQHCMLEMQACS